MSNPLVDQTQLECITAPVCEAQGVELVDVRYRLEKDGAVLRVLIELPNAAGLPSGAGGVTLTDCTNVSRALSQVLDGVEDLIPGAYRLEVSSPGVERPLVKRGDFERYAGREIRVATRRPVSERKSFTGTLLGLRADVVLLREPNGGELDIPFSEISKAHLVFRF